MDKARNVWNGFIALEGIDGSGTTTLASGLISRMDSRGIAVRADSEPTDSPVGLIIREALAGRYPVSPRTLALLFAADRQEHLYGPGGIREHLDAGSLVITDRYLFSSLAYQSLGQSYEWVDDLNRPYPLPSHLVFLDLPVTDAQQRLGRRNGRDIFDDEPLQNRVAAHYRRGMEQYGDSGMEILVVDSTRSPDEVGDEVFSFLEPLWTDR